MSNGTIGDFDWSKVSPEQAMIHQRMFGNKKPVQVSTNIRNVGDGIVSATNSILQGLHNRQQDQLGMKMLQGFQQRNTDQQNQFNATMSAAPTIGGTSSPALPQASPPTAIGSPSDGSFDYRGMIRDKFEGANRNDNGKWDYKQTSGHFGVRQNPGEVLTREQASKRFDSEFDSALSHVDAFAPGLSQGRRHALASLTYNAGTGWQNSGLGRYVKEGNWDKARASFMAYNRAGGQVLPGLTNRRAQELKWFDHADPTPTGQSPVPAPAPAPDSQIQQPALINGNPDIGLPPSPSGFDGVSIVPGDGQQAIIQPKPMTTGGMLPSTLTPARGQSQAQPQIGQAQPQSLRASPQIGQAQPKDTGGRLTEQQFNAERQRLDQWYTNAMTGLAGMDPSVRAAQAPAIEAKYKALMSELGAVAPVPPEKPETVAEGASMVQRQPDGTVRELYHRPKTDQDEYHYNLSQQARAERGLPKQGFDEWKAEQDVRKTRTSETVFSQKLGEISAKDVGEMVEQGRLAQRNLAMGQIAKQILDNNSVEPGTLGYVLRDKLAGWGLPTNAPDEEVLRAAVNRIIPNMRPPGSGSTSDKDMAIYQSSIYNAANTRDGARRIINMYMDQENLAREIGKLGHSVTDDASYRAALQKRDQLFEAYMQKYGDVEGPIRQKFGNAGAPPAGAPPAQKPSGGDSLSGALDSVEKFFTGGQSIPSKAISRLQANPTPDEVRMFDEAFGQGAAQRYLNSKPMDIKPQQLNRPRGVGLGAWNMEPAPTIGGGF